MAYVVRREEEKSKQETRSEVLAGGNLIFYGLKMQRKVVPPELVGELDSRVPKEITDEILRYVVWRKELKAVKKIKRRDDKYFVEHVMGNSVLKTTWCDSCGRPGVRSMTRVDADGRYIEPIGYCDGWQHLAECYGNGFVDVVEKLSAERQFGEKLRKFWGEKL